VSLFYCGLLFLGVVLGGLVLLVIYSLVAMAQKGDKFLDQMELEEFRVQEYTSSLAIRGESDDPGVPVTSDLCHGGGTQPRIFIRG
jgi:hypothetical protein